MLDYEGKVPRYRQLAELLAERIERGEFEPDRPIPSEQQLMQEFGLARGTVRRTVQLLEQQGFVETVPQRGSYVRPRNNWVPKERWQ